MPDQDQAIYADFIDLLSGILLEHLLLESAGEEEKEIDNQNEILD